MCEDIFPMEAEFRKSSVERFIELQDDPSIESQLVAQIKIDCAEFWKNEARYIIAAGIFFLGSRYYVCTFTNECACNWVCVSCDRHHACSRNNSMVVDALPKEIIK